MKILQEVTKELQGFWSWAKIENTYKNNLDNIFINDVYLYSRWDNILNLTKEAVEILSKEYKHEELIEVILLVMGLDNEDGEILEKCEEELYAEAALNLTKSGILYPFFETRWQIAEFILRKNDPILNEYLMVLLEDENKYVQRRALIAISEIFPSLAEKSAWLRIKDEDFMMRLVSLRILSELSSSRLNEALELLSYDNHPLILQEIELIKNSKEE